MDKSQSQWCFSYPCIQDFPSLYDGLDCQDNFGQGFKVGLAPFYSLTFRAKVASLGSWGA